LRLFSLFRHDRASVLILSLLAIAANQIGVDLFYGTRLYLGSIPVVLALLLFGKRGLLVGVASVLCVPRLWLEPQVAIVQLAEVFWLAGFLHLGNERREARERGEIVLADMLFWIVVAIPLDILMFGVLASDDLPTVLDRSLLQGVNGIVNTAAAFSLLILIRIDQSRRDPARSVSLQGLMLISLLGLILLSGMFSLAVAVRQLDREVIDDRLARFRQLALTSAVLQSEALEDLSGLGRHQQSPLDFQVFDGEGRIIYDSNPALFQTLETRYVEPGSPLPQHPQVDEPLDLLIPAESQPSMISGLRGYWRYQSTDDLEARTGAFAASAPDRMVVVVEPARNGIRELQEQSSGAIRSLALLVLVAMIVARGISGFVVRQIPERPLLHGFRAEDDPSAPEGTAGSPPPERFHSVLSELQPLLQALRARADVLVNLRESFRRSERQRHRLEEEVGRLNIIDPLTGCFNRRELYRRLDHELRLSGREERELSFLCLEIDHLRHIHDSYGEPVSAEVLRRIALELRNRSRATDFLCRLGPEQFGLLLPACDAVSAGKVASMLSDVVRSLEIRHERSILAVTLSVGVASLQSHRDDPDALITRAQSALYRAKAEGRDRVVIA
jgi:diguanylate cyclase (GGDEF)-like protein